MTPWPVVPLGEVAETALGKMLDKGKSRGLPRVPYLRNVNVQWGRIDTHDLLEMELADDERERFGVRAGDLLMCEGGEIGRCAIWQGRAEYLAFQKALHRVRPTDRLDATYLRYLMQHHADTGVLAALATGSTIAHLPQQQLRRVPVPLPAVDVQRRIVDLLEDHLSRLDAADVQLGVALRRSEVFRRSAIRTVARADAGWSSTSLSDLLETSIGGVWGSSPGEDEVDVKVVRVTELKAWGRLDLSTAATRSISRRQLATRELREGDLLLEKSGGGPKTPVGRVGYVMKPRGTSVCANFMQLLRPRQERVDPRFLHLALNAFHLSGGTEAMQTASTNIRNLKASEYVTIPVALPDLSAQQRLLAYVHGCLQAVDRLDSQLHAAKLRGGALRRAVLAAAFSGQLTGASSDLDRVEELVDA